MPTKAEAIEYVKTLAAQKVLSRQELTTAFDAGGGAGHEAEPLANKKLGMAEILYYIGGGIVFLGITILVGQNWTTLSFGSKLLATLGAGIAALVAGFLFSRDKRSESAAPAFYLISALVTPIGMAVLLDNAGWDAGSSGSQSLIAGLMLATYLALYTGMRKNMFILFSVLFGTWLFFSLTGLLVAESTYFDTWEFSAYRILLAGLAYVALGFAFTGTARDPLKGFLYGFGCFGFLGAALALGGWQPDQNVFWEFIYPALVFGALFVSVRLKNKSFLVWGTLFLMAYVLKLTSEYFSDSMGWPLALVVAGLAMIGAGFLSITLKKKYLDRTAE